MREVRRRISVMVILLGFAGVAFGETYSVEDIIPYQWIGSVRFTPDGSGMVIQHASAASENRGVKSKLVWVDLRDVKGGRPLFAQEEDEGYSWISPSPDSRYAVYLHYHRGAANVALYDFRGHRSTELDVVPDDVPYWAWISARDVVFTKVSPEAANSSFTEQMSLQWQKMQEGRNTTASAIGSGHYAGRPERDRSEGIVIADIKSGATRLIGAGRFLDQAVSPGGTWLAAVRRVPAMPSSQLRIALDSETGSLEVFDTRQDAVQHEISNSPATLPGSLRWSPSGKRLAFLAMGDNGSGDQPQLWTYDTASGDLRRVDLTGLDPRPATNSSGSAIAGRRGIAFAWLGEELTVLAQPATAVTRPARANWFILRSGAAPINLTAQLSHVAEVVGITRESLLICADGQVWEVKENRPPRLLAGNPGKRVRVINDPAAFPDSTGLPTSSLALEAERPQGPKVVYFLDVTSGHITGRITAPTADARIKAISTPFKRVAFQYTRDNVDVIAVQGVEGAAREMLRLNEFQKGKEAGTFVRIDHQGLENAQKLISWLLLPPGYHQGLPLPTVVHIYPGLAYGVTPPLLDPTDRALLLAAHGYAVLFASLPTDRSLLPREPLQGLADAVLLAVDAARSRGYVDADRLAIQGHSYGGYGVLGVIGQTDRFKAAVSVAGAADLLSLYGQPQLSDRLAGESNGILDTMRPMGWAESGQGGMGAPPWRDSQRYLRNSPLLYVDSINTPIMLVHGELDSAAPFTQSEEMFTALYRLNKDAVFVRYWGEGHHVPVSPANIRDYWRRIYAWYDHYIGPPFDVAKAISTAPKNTGTN